MIEPFFNNYVIPITRDENSAAYCEIMTFISYLGSLL